MYDKYGPRSLLAVGGCLHVIGILAASVAGNHFYALVLSQGVCKSRAALYFPNTLHYGCATWFMFRVVTDHNELGSALGASMMLYPAISSISTWFTKRRALALGLTSTGTYLTRALRSNIQTYAHNAILKLKADPLEESYSP